MFRLACVLVVCLLLAPPTYGQVSIDLSGSTGRGVNANTVRLTGTLLTPLPCCPPSAYTADFQWDPNLACLFPSAVVTGPNGPFLPDLTGAYVFNGTTMQTHCTNPTLNGTFSNTGIFHLTQRGDVLTGFGLLVFPHFGEVDSIGIDAVVTASAATGQIHQLLTNSGLLVKSSFTSTVDRPTLSLTSAGSVPALGCQFTSTGTASLAVP